MKIILSTYNFYPEHKGGTEVYTKALAEYLKNMGHGVLIIAALDRVNELNGKLVADNAEVKAVYYLYEGLDVLGIELKNQAVDDIYALDRAVWTEDFLKFLPELGWAEAKQLIINGISTVSGLSLCDAMVQLNPSVSISVVVHTPFICTKADMIFSGNQKRCEQSLSAYTCASCALSARTGIPFSISRAITFLVNRPPLTGLSAATLFRLEGLLEKRFRSFRLLDKKATAWIVFSEDMRQFLSRQPFISADKISVIRHGINKSIFYEGDNNKEVAPVHFLYAGRFEEVKGVKLLSEAWQRLEEKPNMRQLYLAGNWKETETGRKVADILGKRKDVILIDALRQDELAELYRHTHCVIIPSKWIETGPLVFHEAIACGCDIISSDTGGQGELAGLYKSKSTVFSSGNKDSLYKAIAGYKPSEKDNDSFPMAETEHFDRLCRHLNIPNNNGVNIK